jgi:hypothetical protein
MSQSFMTTYRMSIVDSSCKKPLVICNSIFFIFLNQIKAQKDQKIIVWIANIQEN